MAKGKWKVTASSVGIAAADGVREVEAFVAALPVEQIVPFLAKAVPMQKAFERGVKLAEGRAAAENVIQRGQEWVDSDGGIVYVWNGALGDAELADPAGCYAELSLLDVDTRELDATFFKVWKVDFNNLKRIEAAAARLTKSGNKEEQARGARIVETIRNYRSRKPDGPAHLKEKD